MNSKVFYEVDPHNRLIIKKTKGPSSVKRFRKVVNGRFKTDAKNKLYYEVFKSSDSDIPQKIKFSGDYSLDKKGNLIFIMDKWNNQYAGNRLRLKTGIIDASDSELIFLLNSRISEDKETSYTMKLCGAWRADKNNRIGFDVEKSPDEFDNLTFFNAWKLNEDNEIEYSYGKGTSVVSLKGSWDAGTKNRVSYILNKSIDSGFDFRTSLGLIKAEKGKIHARFDVTIDISKKKRVKRKIIFSGILKPGRDKDIFLEISPGARKNLALRLNRDILGKNGIIFAESFIKGKEIYTGGGVILRW